MSTSFIIPPQVPYIQPQILRLVLAQATRKRETTPQLTRHLSRGIREGVLLLGGVLALYGLASLVTYHAADPGWSVSGEHEGVRNAGGMAGAWFADVFLHLFG